MDGPAKVGPQEALEKLASVVEPDATFRTRLGGVAHGSCGRNFQLFGAITNPGLGIADFVPLTSGITDANDVFRPDWCGTTDRLWRIRTSGNELQRSLAAPAAPLTRAQIVQPDTTALPALTSRGGSVTFKLQVKVRSGTGMYEFLLDAGQPVEVFGKDVEIGLMGPVNSFVVTDNNSANTLQGIVLDAVLGVSIAAAEQSLGQTSPRLTTHHFVPANTAVSIPVPPYAAELSIFTGTGPNPASFLRWIGDPAIIVNALQTGTIDFVAGTSATQSRPVGDETHIQTDIDVNNARFFTVVWTIRP